MSKPQLDVDLKVYDITCLPSCGIGSLPLTRFVVTAASSAEATRKIVQFWQRNYPSNEVKSVDITAMMQLFNATNAVVL